MLEASGRVASGEVIALFAVAIEQHRERAFSRSRTSSARKIRGPHHGMLAAAAFLVKRPVILGLLFGVLAGCAVAHGRIGIMSAPDCMRLECEDEQGTARRSCEAACSQRYGP
jgi:hypothetical protein